MSEKHDDDEEIKLLRQVGLQNVQSILAARQRTDQELISAAKALEEETRILELLNETGALLASRLQLQDLVQAVTDAATKLSGAQFGAFFYTQTNETGGSFMLYTLSGAPREAFEHFGHPRATPLFGPTFRGAGVIRSGDIQRDPRYGKMGPHHGMPPNHLPVRSYLAVPVMSRERVLGGLFFGHAEPDAFDTRAERLVVGVAAQAAVAIDNAQLYENVRRSADERAQLLEAERLARLEIERVSLMKDEFLATLSHELRTPLNAILGWSQLLLSRPNEPEAKRGLETIARNARAQAQLIEDLLDMNRIVSGKIRLDVQRIDLAVAVEAAIDSVRPSADAKSIVLRKTIDPTVAVFGDPNRLQQIVWNLLTNAVKFTPKLGKIDVLLQRVNSHVEITVADTGAGIAPEFLPHVFERFRQADSSTTRHFGGLGLGLSIVKQLVELHGGTVRATSPGVDQGASFVVSLPFRAVQVVEPAARQHPTSGQFPAVPSSLDVSLAGLKVLVVDDEPDARELVASVLQRADAVVCLAASADEALSMVKEKRFDVIVSDIGMPDRDGYYFMREVRQLTADRGGRTPAIALTAFARSEDRTRAMLAGYQVHVSKPIEPSELVATIRSLANQR